MSSDGALVAAKLARPEVPPSYVDRPRLQAALDVATQGLVTLVTGGPGWGKTLLVASWAARAGPARRVVWLTLDADDDPRVFWTYVLAALRASGAVRPGSALASLDLIGGVSAEIHRRIQLGLSQLSHEVVLVIDDVSDARSHEIHDQIACLFRHEFLLRIVLVTRAEPPLLLHRLRVSGHLAELGTADLAFTAQEAADLLVRERIPVTPREVAQLLERTDGWAAGLRLAAMFLRRPGTRPADFGASDQAVADYLRGEVVAGQSPQSWQFLLRTSCVSRICGGLAEALTGQRHGQLALHRLERDNGFVTALGPDRRWYRYHPLLGEMLRRQLDLERPEIIQGLNERAARWFAANDQPIDAMRYAIAARKWSLAGTVFTNAAISRLQTTDRGALAAALARIPSAELGRTAELQLCAAGVCMVEGRYADIPPHLVLARSMLEADVEGSDPSTLIGLSLFEGAVGRIRGYPGTVVTAASSALRILDQHGSALPLAHPYRAIALSNKGVGLLWQGETEQATTFLEAGLEASVASGVELTLVNSLGYLGLAAAVTGRLRAAADWAGRCRTLAEARGWTGLQQVAAGYLALAVVSTMRNDLEEADRLLALGLQCQRRDPERLVMLALRVAQAALDIARGRYDDARTTLDAARGGLDPADGTTLVHRWLTSVEAEVELATASAAGLRSRLESLEPADRSDVDTLLLTRARLADGEAQGLDRLLAPLVGQRRDLHLAVQASLVHALSADRLRRDNEALDALDRALADAEPEHMVSPFTGPTMARLQSLLERMVLLRGPRFGFARAVLKILDPGPAVLVRHPSVEAVTEREKAVLRYLATMLSNAEIADQMYLSPNTIKVHLRHVYRKLGVTSRRAAVRRARELGLFDDGSDPTPAPPPGSR
ncbi:MAG TPA: LuxR C-terminal-related transcriptional regulator [Actinomycetales bacterium]|nr:LuxR C-terminal-related transcriptional regulator [Actinomycetales bacterium]